MKKLVLCTVALLMLSNSLLASTIDYHTIIPGDGLEYNFEGDSIIFDSTLKGSYQGATTSLIVRASGPFFGWKFTAIGMADLFFQPGYFVANQNIIPESVHIKEIPTNFHGQWAYKWYLPPRPIDIDFYLGTDLEVAYVSLTSLRLDPILVQLNPNGDYNYNGKVDAADYTVWKNMGGSPAEYQYWKDHYGETVPIPVPLPEPNSLFLAICGIFIVNRRSR